ncbi:MAG: rhodanese-like domain-containing protein [Cyclobacteriaceae bacterium]|nr:rhodanese-like domain-containing protein [Cyclobacteriaceae bacterium]
MKEISIFELKRLLDKNHPIQLIDVREEWEHREFNIGGLLIPMNTVIHHLDKLDLSKQIIFYCRSGNRSGIVANMLEKNYGLIDLYNLQGGMLEWEHHFKKNYQYINE